MTLEAKIEELTAAVHKLSAVFARYAVPVFTAPALATASAEEVGLENAAKAEELSTVEKIALAEKKTAKPALKKEKPEATTQAAPVVEYVHIQEKVLALLDSSRGGSPNNREKVLNVLAKFEVTTAKALKPEQYAEALEALNGIEA